MTRVLNLSALGFHTLCHRYLALSPATLAPDRLALAASPVLASPVLASLVAYDITHVASRVAPDPTAGPICPQWQQKGASPHFDRGTPERTGVGHGI